MALKHWMQITYQWPINVFAILPIVSQFLVCSCYCGPLPYASVGPWKTPAVTKVCLQQADQAAPTA